MTMEKKHMGFAAAARSVAQRQGVSMESADKMIAAGARKASQKAVNANPRLARVPGAKKPK